MDEEALLLVDAGQIAQHMGYGAGDEGCCSRVDKIDLIGYHKYQLLIGNRFLHIGAGGGKGNDMVARLYSLNIFSCFEHHPGNIKAGAEGRLLAQMIAA